MEVMQSLDEPLIPPPGDDGGSDLYISNLPQALSLELFKNLWSAHFINQS
jgi:hypothetical protein